MSATQATTCTPLLQQLGSSLECNLVVKEV